MYNFVDGIFPWAVTISSPLNPSIAFTLTNVDLLALPKTCFK